MQEGLAAHTLHLKSQASLLKPATSQLLGVLRKSDYWRGESWREEMVCGAEKCDKRDLLHTPYITPYM
jgi:hypothetical protein